MTEAASDPASSFRVLAQIHLSGYAVPAALAAPAAVDQHGIAYLESFCTGPESGHDAGVLMAEREGQLIRERALWPFQQVDVGMTQAGRRDPHEHLAGRWVRHRYLAQLRFCLPPQELHCAHRGGRRAAPKAWPEVRRRFHIEVTLVQQGRDKSHTGGL